MEHIRISKLNTDSKSASEISSSKVRGMQTIIVFYFRAHFVGVKNHIFVNAGYPTHTNPLSYTEFESVCGSRNRTFFNKETMR
jgi:hypothetical protein